MLPNSNLNFKPCYRIRNPRKFCLWNPESWVLESGIQIKESGIPITIGIQNSTVLQKNTGIQYLESGIHSVESRIQDCAGLFPYMGWRMSIYNYIHTEIYSLKSYDVNFHITWIFEPQALSSTNYFSMSILRGSITVGEVILFTDASLAYDQAPQWGKRRKKSASEASWEVVWGGENVAPAFPPPQATARLASFADIFPIWPRFLPFSPTAEPGPRLMAVTLWNLRNYLWKTKSQLHVSNTSSLITNNKNEHWKTVRSTSFPKPQLKSVSIFFKFINPCFVFYFLCQLYLLLIVFERLF